MPVLARLLEAAGLPTVVVTSMPFWTEKLGTPRTLAVGFPFGYTLGLPGDVALQMQVLEEALGLLVSAEAPNVTVESTAVWPTGLKEARKMWHPAEPAPIIAHLGPQIRQMLKSRK